MTKPDRNQNSGRYWNLTRLTQNSRAFSHGAPTPICSASAAILTCSVVSLADSDISESMRARCAFCIDQTHNSLISTEGKRIQHWQQTDRCSWFLLFFQIVDDQQNFNAKKPFNVKVKTYFYRKMIK